MIVVCWSIAMNQSIRLFANRKSSCIHWSERMMSIEFVFEWFTYWNVFFSSSSSSIERFNLFLCDVFTGANNIFNFHCGHHFAVGEFTDDFRWWITALFMNQFIAFQCNDTFNFTSIQCFFIEFLAQFKWNFRCFECGRCNQCVDVTVFLQFNSWWNRVTDFTENKANTCGNNCKNEYKL